MERVQAGEPAAIARLISRAEHGNPEVRGALAKIYKLAGKAHVVVVTGKGSGLGDAVGADPSPVDVVLKTGAKRYCMHFGGTEKLKVGKKASLQNAPAPGACPP